MKKIIYTTDYSQNSVTALKYAVSVGRLLGDDVIVLHVYDPQEENEEGQNLLKQEVRKKHQKKLLEFCQEHLEQDYSSTELSVAAIKGRNVPRTISDFVRDMNVHMIIMGACGTSTMREFFLGSTTKEMISVSPFPILAVPPDYEPGKLNKVFFASVLDDEDIEHLGELIQILNAVKPEIEVVHITHKEPAPAQQSLKAFEEKVKSRIDYPKISFRSVFSHNVYDTLKIHIEESKPDIVVMPEHNEKNEVDRMIIRERIKRVQSCTKRPLLSFPPVV